ncbi:protein-L-isoaspartate(D-aspartate) O-methyltransferase [Halovulum sp. GXIMD14793]
MADPSVMEFVMSLRMHGVIDTEVLRAMEITPRDTFLTETFRQRAHDDVPLPIECGQTISQPSVVGLMTQALKMDRRCTVLEVGTGSGYQAAILSHLARRVYTTERHKTLARTAKARLDQLGYTNVTVIPADGTRGLPDQAPFDRILVTAAAEDPPSPLLEQLKVGGIMVLPVGQTDAVQTLVKVVKLDKGYDYHDLGAVRFVPLIEGMSEE